MEEFYVKYPIGVQDFEKLITEGYVYVDKTAILYRMVKTGNCCFLSRPRRFGKSLTLSTLKAYFEGKRDLFKGLAMERLEKDWKKHPVFLISFARFEKRSPQSMEDLLAYHLRQWEEEYGVKEISNNFENRFAALIKKAYDVTGQKVVVLVDEYDSALVTSLESPELHDHIKSLLKPFYTVLKDLDQYIQFALLTGITRFSKMTIFSGLNNLKDLSLDPAYSEICGITPTELEENFPEGIKRLGETYGLDHAETLQKLKAYYDGYHFTKNSADIYNPFSILYALDSKNLSNYWFSTGIPSFLVERMKSRDLDLEKYMNQTATETILQEADSAYSSDTAILFQAGFLTIKEYNQRKNEYQLGIPNREVREGMSRLFMEKFLNPDRQRDHNFINDLIDAIEEGEPERFMTLMKAFFAGVPYDLSKGDKEVYFQNSFYILSNLIGLRVEAERHTSQGSIDLMLSTPDYIYLFEFKLNKKPEVALAQINSKDYALAWETRGRKVFKIGASFSSRTRRLSSWIIESY